LKVRQVRQVFSSPNQELIRGVIPFVIRRFLPDNTYEDWKERMGKGRVRGMGLEDPQILGFRWF
jgi:hypothetical protein